MPAQRHVIVSLALVAALAAAGCTGPGQTGAGMLDGGDDDVVESQSVSGSPGGVGGSVKNSAPTFESFTTSDTTGENRGLFTVVLSGVVRDANTESQIRNVSIASTGPAALVSVTHVVTNDEKNAETEPATYGSDGFKVWTGTKNDGLLNFRFRVTFPAFHPVGSYTFVARAYDNSDAGAVSGAVAVALTAFSDITINAAPVDAAGVALTGKNWGEWEAEPGARGVASTNYIKLVNTGDLAATSVVIDFASAFVGATDPTFSIPVASNVEFAWFEDTTPTTSAPNEGTFSYAPANAEGAVTVAFTAKSNVIYVAYRIVELPDVLPIQSYGIAYTVTEL